MQSGAMPHFECRDEFIADYRAFLAKAARGPGAGA